MTEVDLLKTRGPELIEALQLLLERGKITLDNDGYIVLMPRPNPLETPAMLEAVKAAMRAWTTGEANIRGAYSVLSGGKVVAGFESSEEAYEHVLTLNAQAAIATLTPLIRAQLLAERPVDLSAKEVAQVDREAAWPFAPLCFTGDPNPGAKERWMAGVYDNQRIIQAFAAHRLASYEAGRKDREAEIVAWLRDWTTYISGVTVNDAEKVANAIERENGSAGK